MARVLVYPPNTDWTKDDRLYRKSGTVHKSCRYHNAWSTGNKQGTIQD